MIKLIVTAIIFTWYFTFPAYAHDVHPGMSSEERQIAEFYSSWRRPQGNFPGLVHRKHSCCNQADCFPVTQIQVVGGRYKILVQGHWYFVDPSIDEESQTDPRESPDNAAHACIIGGVVACFVKGSGS